MRFGLQEMQKGFREEAVVSRSAVWTGRLNCFALVPVLSLSVSTDDRNWLVNGIFAGSTCQEVVVRPCRYRLETAPNVVLQSALFCVDREV